MSFDLGIIKNLVETRDQKNFDRVIESGIDQFLVGDGKIIFDFIKRHFAEYGNIPEKEIIKERLGGMILDGLSITPNQPLTFFIDSIRQRALNTHLESVLRQAIEHVKEGKPFQGMEKLKEGMHKAAEYKLEKGAGVNLTKDFAPRIQEYKKIEALGDAIDGWRSPWQTMNKVTQGFHPGDVSFFVGRLGIGKTWSLLATMAPAVKQGASSLVITMEMEPQRLGRRLDALFGNFPYDSIKKAKLSPEEYQKYETLLKEKYKDLGDLWCYGPPRVKTVTDIELLIERHKPDIVFIDGVYLLGGGGVTDRYTKVLHAAEELKYMAVAKSVSIIGTIQFTKAGSQGKRLNKMDADVEDIGYSYGLGQIADNVFGVFQNDDFRANKHLLINFLKLREAEKSRGFVVNWDFETMNFEELGQWDGEQVLKTDENGNIIETPILEDTPQAIEVKF